jgi:lipoate-protein ligase A
MSSSMEIKSTYKVPNGKLLKIKLNYRDKKIKEINITGDFFVYPEESIEIIEKELVDVTLDQNEILKKIKTIKEKNMIDMIGISPEGITKAIMMCLK